MIRSVNEAWAFGKSTDMIQLYYPTDHVLLQLNTVVCDRSISLEELVSRGLSLMVTAKHTAKRNFLFCGKTIPGLGRWMYPAERNMTVRDW
jgi:hypothetical protein